MSDLIFLLPCVDHNHRVPGFVFRGQILSVTLAAVLIGFILLREWITQHNWAEHVPRPVQREPEVNPEEWTISGGVAYKTEDVKEFAQGLVEAGRLKLASEENRVEGSTNETERLATTKARNGPTPVTLSSLGETPQVEAVLKVSKSEAEQRRIEAQKKMVVWQPITEQENGITSPDSSTAPNSAPASPLDEATATLRESQLVSPLSTPHWSTDFSADKAVAGPSRISSFSAPYPIVRPDSRSGLPMPDSIPRTSSSGHPISPLTSPGGGPPRPPGPPKDATGVAYTAPELLIEKGKGKARTVVAEEEVEDHRPYGGDASDPDIGVVDQHPRKVFPTKEEFLCRDDDCIIERQAGYDMSFTEIETPDTAVPSDSQPSPGDNVPVGEINETLSRRHLQTTDEHPPDSAYRDPSSGRRSPPTIWDQTLPTSEGYFAAGSPEDRIVTLPAEDDQVVNDPAAVFEAPAGPEDDLANGDDVDVEFLAEEEEEGHWDREDWDGVLEGGLHPSVQRCADKSVIGLIGPLQGMVQNARTTIFTSHKLIVTGHFRQYHHGCLAHGPRRHPDHRRKDLPLHGPAIHVRLHLQSHYSSSPRYHRSYCRRLRHAGYGAIYGLAEDPRRADCAASSLPPPKPRSVDTLPTVKWSR